jgi:hypothetical protein
VLKISIVYLTALTPVLRDANTRNLNIYLNWFWCRLTTHCEVFGNVEKYQYHYMQLQQRLLKILKGVDQQMPCSRSLVLNVFSPLRPSAAIDRKPLQLSKLLPSQSRITFSNVLNSALELGYVLLARFSCMTTMCGRSRNLSASQCSQATEAARTICYIKTFTVLQNHNRDCQK